MISVTWVLSSLGPLTARRSRVVRRLATATAAALLTGLAVAGPAAPASAANVTTPRNFTGYGFDQCLAPTQKAMDAWLESSPFWAVGIYISGYSRACRSQPNLTPEWISTQLKNRWRILPITLGPQASCSTRFPRYGNDKTINPDPTSTYKAARTMGRKEAVIAVDAATALGISPGSTLWYDLEAFNTGNTHCRKSAMWFLHGWTKGMHLAGYVSGVYSSAASGIRALDDLRVDKPKAYLLPDRIWIADWNGVADTSSTYIRPDGWLPGNRMKQYRGGHNETHGGVTINIDSNFLDLGRGSVSPKPLVRCGGVKVDFPTYPTLASGANGPRVKALQCLLSRQRLYSGPVDGVMGASTVAAVQALRSARGLPAGSTADARVWVSLHAWNLQRLLKYGAASEAVRRLQRTLNAASKAEKLAITGVYESTTTAAVKRYQKRRGLTQTGVTTAALWTSLQSGKL